MVKNAVDTIFHQLVDGHESVKITGCLYYLPSMSIIVRVPEEGIIEITDASRHLPSRNP